MNLGILLLLYFQIFACFFTYFLARRLMFITFKDLKVVVNKRKDMLAFEIKRSEKYLKLSLIWPVIILLWSYEKIKK